MSNKLIKFYIKKGFSYFALMWSIPPLICLCLLALFHFDILAPESSVPVFLDKLIFMLLPTEDKMAVYLILICSVIFGIWLLSFVYKMPIVEKVNFRFIYSKFIHLFVGLIVILSGLIMAFWILSFSSKLGIERTNFAIAESFYFIFFASTISIYSRWLFDLTIVKST